MRIPDWLNHHGDITYRGESPKEDAELITAINWIRRTHPSLASITVHIENEGKRTRAQADLAKAKGMLSGAVDIVILTCPPIAIEMKRRDHTKSTWQGGQLAFLESVHQRGGYAAVCFGAEGFKQAIACYLQKYTHQT